MFTLEIFARRLEVVFDLFDWRRLPSISNFTFLKFGRLGFPQRFFSLWWESLRFLWFGTTVLYRHGMALPLFHCPFPDRASSFHSLHLF